VKIGVFEGPGSEGAHTHNFSCLCLLIHELFVILGFSFRV
jgi:hypothetical protein